MNFQYNAYVLPLLIIAAEAVGLIMLVWQRRPGKRGVTAFTAEMIAVTIWSLSYALELAATDLPTKLIFVKLQFVGIVSAPVIFLLFVTEYTGREKWQTPRYVIPHFIIPLATIIILWTNELHGLMYQHVRLDTSGAFPNFVGVRGVWFWVHATYSYIVMLLAVVFLVSSIARAPQLYRGQAATLLIGVLAPWVGNAIYIFNLSPFPNLDLTPFAFAITGLAFAWSLFGFRLLDIVPTARDVVFESMDDAIIVMDIQDRVVDLNGAARAIVGPSAETAIGRYLTEVMPEQRTLIESFLSVSQLRTELTFGVDETARTFDLRISPVNNRRGDRSGRLVVLRDITQRKQVEKKLAEARDQALEALRLKSRILAVVSHDFRTPLGAILGFAEMLKEGMLGKVPDAQLGPIERIIANTNQLTDLVNDLLDQAQLEAGKITLHVSQFPPTKLLDTIETTMGPKAREKNLRLITVVSPGVPSIVRGDISRLNQAVTNLVGNALKFTKEGEVKVRFFKADEDHWAVEITDTGPGISKQDQEHIFDPFWQVDFSETREHTGMGLGLSIVKQLVQRLSGQIAVESELGKGTKFTITLPIDPTREIFNEQTARADR
jgi:PAS domain S-box-containing protein